MGVEKHETQGVMEIGKRRVLHRHGVGQEFAVAQRGALFPDQGGVPGVRQVPEVHGVIPPSTPMIWPVM